MRLGITIWSPIKIESYSSSSARAATSCNACRPHTAAPIASCKPYFIACPSLSSPTDKKHLSRQLCEQRLRLLQVFGVKPLGEPVVYLRQHLSGFCLLA